MKVPRWKRVCVEWLERWGALFFFAGSTLWLCYSVFTTSWKGVSVFLAFAAITTATTGLKEIFAMFAERYLEKQKTQGRREGKAEGIQEERTAMQAAADQHPGMTLEEYLKEKRKNGDK